MSTCYVWLILFFIFFVLSEYFTIKMWVLYLWEENSLGSAWKNRVPDSEDSWNPTQIKIPTGPRLILSHGQVWANIRLMSSFLLPLRGPQSTKMCGPAGVQGKAWMLLPVVRELWACLCDTCYCARVHLYGMDCMYQLTVFILPFFLIFSIS